MTPKQIALVRNTFTRLAPISDLTAALFYDRLFRLNPMLRPVFQGRLPDQKKKLIASIQLMIDALDRPDEVLPIARDMGCRYAAYGIRPQTYDIIGQALFWALEQVLGSGFTPEVAAAWATAYEHISSTMKEGAAAAELAPAWPG